MSSFLTKLRFHLQPPLGQYASALEDRIDELEAALETPRQYDVLVSDWKERADLAERALSLMAADFAHELKIIHSATLAEEYLRRAACGERPAVTHLIDPKGTSR